MFIYQQKCTNTPCEYNLPKPRSPPAPTIHPARGNGSYSRTRTVGKCDRNEMLPCPGDLRRSRTRRRRGVWRLALGETAHRAPVTRGDRGASRTSSGGSPSGRSLSLDSGGAGEAFKRRAGRRPRIPQFSPFPRQIAPYAGGSALYTRGASGRAEGPGGAFKSANAETEARFNVGRCGSGGRAVVWRSEGCRFDSTLGVSQCP